MRDHPPASTDPQAFWGAQFDLGLAWVHFPHGRGGLGLDPDLQQVVDDRLRDAGAPDPMLRNFMGLGMMAPTLVAFGTEEQQARLLRPIFTCDEIWCQMFSEPGAGSDVASLATSAVPDGDEWVLNGQKVWTSMAHVARWGLLLVRTDPHAPKHRGLTYFYVDMHAPGIEVRPLRQMTGSDEFNEVFLEDVRVPADHLVGEPTRGWQIAQTTLAHERGTAARQLVIHRMLLADLMALAREAEAKGAPGRQDACIRQRIAQHWIEVEIMKLTNWRTLTRMLRSEPLGPESSSVKLFWSEMSQRMHDTAMDLMGPFGLLASGSPRAVRNGRLQRSYVYYRAATIFAGTSEIQRNIIAQRILGLPRG